MSETPEVQLEKCSRSGESREIAEVVAGRTGTVPCSDCDNSPDLVLPGEIPDDPQGRLEEIESQLAQLNEKEQEAKKNQGTHRRGSGPTGDGRTERPVGRRSDNAARPPQKPDSPDWSSANRHPYSTPGTAILREEKHTLEAYLDALEDGDSADSGATDDNQETAEGNEVSEP